MSTLLVTGASGHFGQRVLHHLLDTLHVEPARIVAASRQPERLAAFAARGVATRRADFDDAASLAGAFAGIARALIVSTDALDRPGKRLEQHRAAVAAAEQAGVAHLVYTSMPGPHDSFITFAPDHAGTEDALAASRVPGWTVLRNHWYFDNLFHSLPAVLANGGQWYSAAGDGKVANLSRDDLALAAATALTGSSQGREVYTLSGEEALTTAEQAERIGRAIGRPLTVVPVTVADLERGMVAAGLPEPVARAYASFDANTAAGHVGTVTGDYRRLVGRAPQSFDAWLAENAAALRG